jgi:hypothetical protein
VEFCDIENPFTVSEAYELVRILHDGKQGKGEFRLINTGTIDPYKSLWGEKMTSYIKRKYTRPLVLKKELRELMPNRFEQSSSPKLVITGMRYFESYLDENGSYIAGKSTIIVRNPRSISLHVLLALLNSKLVGFYMKEAYKSSGIEGGVTFRSTMVENIPIPEMTVDKKQTLNEFARNILSSIARGEKKKYNELQEKLNACVYRLYGLSKNDIDVIDKYKVHPS